MKDDDGDCGDDDDGVADAVLGDIRDESLVVDVYSSRLMISGERGDGH